MHAKERVKLMFGSLIVTFSPLTRGCKEKNTIGRKLQLKHLLLTTDSQSSSESNMMPAYLEHMGNSLHKEWNRMLWTSVRLAELTAG